MPPSNPGGPPVDELDRHILNALQGGFPLCERPFAVAAQRLGTTEDTLIARMDRLLEQGTLSRFGPLYNAERMGGALTLCALQVPPEDLERVAEQDNALPEVAHNYAREHRLNMWFVLATEDPQGIERAIAEIERRTGLQVHDFPKIEEFFVGLQLEA
jgi:DNA-binding Lrp family transcriptional regulator